MTHDDVQRWLDRYITAWRTYDPGEIADLFASEATYAFNPWGEGTVVGRDAIVESWRDDRDEPGSWEAWYKPFAVEGDRAAVIGESKYTNPDGTLRDLYYNNWTLRFDADGRCVEFVESFMELPKRLKATHA